MAHYQAFYKKPEADLRRDSRWIFEASLLITLFLLALLFYSFKNFDTRTSINKKIDWVIETVEIPLTIQEKIAPPPLRPVIPIASENEELPEELTIPETEINFAEQPLSQILPPPVVDDDIEYPFHAVSEKPEVLHKVNPDFPEIAKRAEVSGMVVVKVLIGTQGNVEKVEVVKSNPMLDEAAVAAAWQFKFKPGKQRDRAVKVWMNIPFTFRFKN
jgi:periplasmic protein TonB